MKKENLTKELCERVGATCETFIYWAIFKDGLADEISGYKIGNDERVVGIVYSEDDAKAISAALNSDPRGDIEKVFGFQEARNYNARQAEMMRGILLRIRDSVPGGHACDLDGLVSIVQRLSAASEGR